LTFKVRNKMADSETATVTPLRPAKGKDTTAALRQRRHRTKAKTKRSPRPAVTTPVPVADTPQPEISKEIKPDVTVARHVTTAGTDVLPYLAAVALAGAAAWFSIRGMVVLFPGSPLSVIAMASAMEAAKLVTAGWLARRWSATAWVWRLVLAVLVAGLAVINAAGVYAQLVAAHVGDRAASAAAVQVQDVDIAARIEVAAGRVADLDRQIAQIDGAVAAATQRGKTGAAVSIIDGQRRARAGLAGEREKAAGALAALKAERATVAAQGHRIETEAAPIVYVAEMLGIGTDSERAIRWLIALMVLCCDPLAIALTAAASARETPPRLTADSQTRQRDSFTPAARSGLHQPSPQSIASAMRAI
jgi:hypothetical protein